MATHGRHGDDLPPDSICIVLRMTDRKNNPHLYKRTIDLENGWKCVIGRASASRKILAAEDNAMFDSEVVSRQHAIIQYDGWRPIAGDGTLAPRKVPNIYIIDTGSMHGTFVDGKQLEKDKPMFLEGGEVLSLGVAVKHEDKTYMPVKCTFEYYDPEEEEDAIIHGEHFSLFQVPSSPSDASSEEYDVEDLMSEAEELKNEAEELENEAEKVEKEVEKHIKDLQSSDPIDLTEGDPYTPPIPTPSSELGSDTVMATKVIDLCEDSPAPDVLMAIHKPNKTPQPFEEEIVFVQETGPADEEEILSKDLDIAVHQSVEARNQHSAESGRVIKETQFVDEEDGDELLQTSAAWATAGIRSACKETLNPDPEELLKEATASLPPIENVLAGPDCVYDPPPFDPNAPPKAYRPNDLQPKRQTMFGRAVPRYPCVANVDGKSKFRTHAEVRRNIDNEEALENLEEAGASKLEIKKRKREIEERELEDAQLVSETIRTTENRLRKRARRHLATGVVLGAVGMFVTLASLPESVLT